GADQSTTFTDVSVGGGHGNASILNQAQVDTAVKKWGTGSLLLDGTDDGIYYSAKQFNFCDTGNYTADAQIYLTADSTNHTIFIHPSTNDYWLFGVGSTEKLYFTLYKSGEIFNITGDTTLSLNTWYHCAAIKVGNAYGIYLAGDQDGYASNATTLSQTATFYVGASSEYGDMEGNADELRLGDSNLFNAAPNIGKTDTIDVPTKAYSVTLQQILMIN
ncbi:unnamed protein product, partial [marine sediment metagenome]